MRAVIQRVKNAKVSVENNIVGKIQRGILVFFAVSKEDELSQIPWIVNKLVNLRIFPDKEGRLNLSLKDIKGEVLAISQFTLYGDCSKGRRPSFIDAMEPAKAEVFYDEFVGLLRKEAETVQTGVFGADMEVSLVNDGPVTLIVEAKKS